MWRARHHVWADQVVAVKIPTDSRYLLDLQREGLAIHRVAHPNIVKAINFDPYATPAYFVMEYVPGVNLRVLLLRDGPLSVSAALSILTDAGTRTVELWATHDPDTLLASVEMGPATPLPSPANWHSLELDPARPVMHLSLGNPHSVVATDDVHAVDLIEAGSLVPHINLELIQPGPEPHAITMRVHERGAGITEACGTGATAAAHAAAAWGLVAKGTTEIIVHMDGGDAKVRLGDSLTLIGPTTYIATATVEV